MTTSMDSTDNDTGESAFDGLKEQSLKAAGYAYLVGDAGLFASGMMSGRHKEAISGLTWGIGGLACAKYANPDAEKQLKMLGDKLSHYLQKQGVQIPHNPDTAALTQENGVIDHIETFMYQHPSQILNATYAIGATQLIRSGMQHHKPWDAASGALIAAGALGGLLIQEKKPDPDHPPVGMFNKAVAWIQEKPLRVPGIMYALNNITLLTSAADEWKTNPAQKSYVFKFLTAASYIFGNAMLSISSKGGHNDSTNVAMDKLATASAHVIAAQPRELQEALIQNIAGFLSAQPNVPLKADEISALLHAKLQSPAQAPQGWAQRVSVPPLAPALPSF